MSWILFLDESGHDHKQMPYEVRGGVALEDSQLWPFVQAMQRLELDCFGAQLHQYHKELKGSTLLDRKRFQFANQASPMEPEARRKHARGFLTRGLEKKTPTRDEFTAYGQACLEMARGTFQLLRGHKAVLLASAIPASVQKPDQPHIEEFLRKDHVFLLERFFYFLEAKREHGLLVMDEVEKRDTSSRAGESFMSRIRMHLGGRELRRRIKKEATQLEPPTRSRSAAEPPITVSTVFQGESSGISCLPTFTGAELDGVPLPPHPALRATFSREGRRTNTAPARGEGFLCPPHPSLRRPKKRTLLPQWKKASVSAPSTVADASDSLICLCTE